MAEKTKSSTDLLKSLLVIVFPLITAIVTANVQYVVTRQEESDKNYRVVVSQLASKDREIRHAAAASLGTYVKAGDRYFSETIDILTNRLSSETNYNVRNSIIGSLKKIKKLDSEYKLIIDRLLTISRNSFIQDYHMDIALKNARLDYDILNDDLRIAESEGIDKNLSSNQLNLSRLKNRVSDKVIEINKLQKEYDELQYSKPIISDMISIFLSEKKNSAISGLDFFRTTMSSVILTDLTLTEPTVKWATFYNSNLTDTTLDNAVISQTDFSKSLMIKTSLQESNIATTLFVDTKLIEASFSNSNFSEVFFILADLSDTNFAGVKGLKPEYFYQSI